MSSFQVRNENTNRTLDCNGLPLACGQLVWIAASFSEAVAEVADCDGPVGGAVEGAKKKREVSTVFSPLWEAEVEVSKVV